MRRLRSFTLDDQIESGGAWVGTPDEIKAIIRRVTATMGEIRARLAADQLRHHRRGRSAEVDAVVRVAGDAGILRARAPRDGPSRWRKRVSARPLTVNSAVGPGAQNP